MFKSTYGDINIFRGAPDSATVAFRLMDVSTIYFSERWDIGARFCYFDGVRIVDSGGTITCEMFYNGQITAIRERVVDPMTVGTEYVNINNGRVGVIKYAGDDYVVLSVIDESTGLRQENPIHTNQFRVHWKLRDGETDIATGLVEYLLHEEFREINFGAACGIVEYIKRELNK